MVALALSFTLGAHWAVLQTVAWTSMVVNYSRTTTLSEAVSRTFDGKHLCKLCKLVKAGRGEEKQSEQAPLSAKIDLILQQNLIVLASPMVDVGMAPAAVYQSQHSLSPPTPPPRAA